MNILAPFSNQSEIKPLVEAGASEFYCGVVDEQWKKTFTYVSSINLRHDRAANLSSFEELSSAVEEAHSLKAKVFLTLNAHFYSEKQLPMVLKQAEKAVDAGVDSLIVSDTALIPRIVRELGAHISLSTGNPVFNSQAIDFFKELGVAKIVFPRHLTVEEIKELSKHAKANGIGTECFVLNVICPYIDGLCTFQHIVEESLGFVSPCGLSCRAKFEAKAFGNESSEKKLMAEAHVGLWGGTTTRDCGLCAIPFFKDFGVDAVKIAGRAHSLEKKLADVNAVSKAIELANSEHSLDAFRELYFNLFHNKCDYANCYYAGVGFG